MTQDEIIQKHFNFKHSVDRFSLRREVRGAMDEWNKESPNNTLKWIDARERPLVTYNENGHWECTNAGNKEFVAAIPYQNTEYSGKQFWWIRLCVLEDEIGLCVVGDDDNEPAGWNIDDVTHYFHLPEHP